MFYLFYFDFNQIILNITRNIFTFCRLFYVSANFLNPYYHSWTVSGLFYLIMAENRLKEEAVPQM